MVLNTWLCYYKKFAIAVYYYYLEIFPFTNFFNFTCKREYIMIFIFYKNVIFDQNILKIGHKFPLMKKSYCREKTPVNIQEFCWLKLEVEAVSLAFNNLIIQQSLIYRMTSWKLSRQKLLSGRLILILYKLQFWNSDKIFNESRKSLR